MNNYYQRAPHAYDETMRGIPGDVEFYRDLAIASGGPVVELGVGTGRIAIPTAVAGVEVIGIDLAPEMLAVAHTRAAAAGVASRLHLVQGDMRTFTVAEPVPLVTIPFRTFLHNLTDADRIATLHACHRALLPGGRLAFNVFNPALSIIQRGLGTRAQDRERSGVIAPNELAAAVALGLADRPLAGALAGGRHPQHGTLTLRYVTREEVEAFLDRAGFTVEALTGDCLGTPFGEHSTELVWVARRN